jgi:hypothetical protein
VIVFVKITDISGVNLQGYGLRTGEVPSGVCERVKHVGQKMKLATCAGGAHVKFDDMEPEANDFELPMCIQGSGRNLTYSRSIRLNSRVYNTRGVIFR